VHIRKTLTHILIKNWFVNIAYLLETVYSKSTPVVYENLKIININLK